MVDDERYRSFFEQSMDGVLFTRPDGAILEANPAACEILRMSEREICARGRAGLADPTDQRWVAGVRERTRTGRFRGDLRMLRGDGSAITTEVTSQVYTGADGALHTCIVFRDITERLRLAEELLKANERLEEISITARESEERLRSILDSMFCFVGVFSPAGTLIEANRAPLLAFGLSREEIVGRPFWELELWSHSPSTREQVRDALQRAAQGTNVREDLVARVADGRLVTIDAMFGPLYDREGRLTEVIGSGVDVTDRERAGEALRASEARLRQAQQLAQIGSWELDLRANVLTWSDEVYRLFEIDESQFGASYEAFIGLIHPDDRDAVNAAYEVSLETREPYEMSHRLQMPDGRIKYVIERCENEYDEAGKPIRSVGTVQDVTERVQLAEARRLEAIGTLAGGIAHDFNNILGAILGNVELALLALGSENAVAGRLEDVRQASMRAAELVGQILTFSRESEEPRHVIALVPVVEEAVALVRAGLPEHIELCTGFAEDVPNVLANATQIHQIVMNLCTNARQAIGDDPGRIDVEVDVVDGETPNRPAELAPGPYVRLLVRDTGVGMDASARSRAFDPFFTTKPFGHGTGLGLSVVQGIVNAHGGAITLATWPGEGARFDLYFPAAAGTTPERSTPPGLDLPLGRGARVLYVDDQESLVSLGVRLLEQLGYRPTGHTSPEEALEAVRADPDAVDVVLADFNMQGLSGLDLARRLLKLRPDLPVVLMSGYVTDELEAEAARLGIRLVLQKPTTVDTIAVTLHRLLDRDPGV